MDKVLVEGLPIGCQVLWAVDAWFVVAAMVSVKGEVGWRGVVDLRGAVEIALEVYRRICLLA